MISAAEAAKDADLAKREVADVKNQADGLIYATEKAIEEYGHALDPQDLDDIKADLAACKEAVDAEDGEAIREAIVRLETSSHKIAEAMYEEAAEAMEE
jgi:molecular chaperone DnaK